MPTSARVDVGIDPYVIAEGGIGNVGAGFHPRPREGAEVLPYKKNPLPISRQGILLCAINLNYV